MRKIDSNFNSKQTEKNLLFISYKKGGNYFTVTWHLSVWGTAETLFLFILRVTMGK